VASIGLDDNGGSSWAGGTPGGLPGATQVAPTIDSNERQQVLNMFNDKP
jgi:hypothetical protein